MTIVVALLLVNGVLGAADTLWYHEWKGRLPARGGAFRVELGLHAGRDAIYAVVYGTIGWVAWHGSAGIALAGLLLAEIVITLADFIVEDRIRPTIGGMAKGERVLHTLMAIVYGAMLAHLLPLLLEWTATTESGLVRHAQPVPSWMAVMASLLGVGIALSGARDAVAALRGVHRAERRSADEPLLPVS